MIRGVAVVICDGNRKCTPKKQEAFSGTPQSMTAIGDFSASHRKCTPKSRRLFLISHSLERLFRGPRRAHDSYREG